MMFEWAWYQFCMLLVKLGVLTAYLVCERCGREVELGNCERHDAAFHGE